MLAVGKKGEKNGERKSAASGLVLVSSASSGLGGEPDFPLERLCCCRGWGLMWVWQEGGGGVTDRVPSGWEAWSPGAHRREGGWVLSSALPSASVTLPQARARLSHPLSLLSFLFCSFQVSEGEAA